MAIDGRPGRASRLNEYERGILNLDPRRSHLVQRLRPLRWVRSAKGEVARRHQEDPTVR